MTISTKKVSAAIRKNLVAAVAAQSGVDSAQVILDGKRAGMYGHCVLAAISANGDKGLFIGACDALMAEFRSNKRGIAVKYSMEQAQTKQGKPAVDSEGNPIFKVPGSLSTAKSTLGRAFDNGVPLVTDGSPNAFSAIRDAASVAADEKAAANATPNDKARANIRESLTAIGDALAKLDGKSLKTLDRLLQATAKGLKPANPASRKAAKAAAS